MPLARYALTMLVGVVFLAGGADANDPSADESTARATFDADPAWDGFRNRLLPSSLPRARQDFGYRSSNHAGGATPGEIGGIVQRTTTMASYGKAIAVRTLDDRLSASGKLVVPRADASSGVMIGWFHESSRGWRTPNSLAFRVDGNSGKYWLFYEYGTRTWKTGGGGAFEGDRYQTTPTRPFVADKTIHAWSLDYDPAGNEGKGLVTFRIDDRTYQVRVAADHRADGATFNRFGIWNVQAQGEQLELYVDDLVVDGEHFAFDRDPRWVGVGNQAEFVERVIRPLHDFGFSPTAFCGRGQGEIGGIIFRDERPAYYAAPCGPLSLDMELRASGKLCFVKAGSDSGVYLGWFSSADKRRHEWAEYEVRQKNYLAILLEGPSHAGHYFRPSYSTRAGRGLTADGDGGGGPPWPLVRPDGRVHDWSLDYRPGAADGKGQIELILDGERRTMDLAAGDRQAGAEFDRFGIFNLQAGGHHVEVYLDDVSFTRSR